MSQNKAKTEKKKDSRLGLAVHGQQPSKVTIATKATTGTGYLKGVLDPEMITIIDALSKTTSDSKILNRLDVCNAFEEVSGRLKQLKEDNRRNQISLSPNPRETQSTHRIATVSPPGANKTTYIPRFKTHVNDSMHTMIDTLSQWVSPEVWSIPQVEQEFIKLSTTIEQLNSKARPYVSNTHTLVHNKPDTRAEANSISRELDYIEMLLKRLDVCIKESPHNNSFSLDPQTIPQEQRMLRTNKSIQKIEHHSMNIFQYSRERYDNLERAQKELNQVSLKLQTYTVDKSSAGNQQQQATARGGTRSKTSPSAKVLELEDEVRNLKQQLVMQEKQMKHEHEDELHRLHKEYEEFKLRDKQPSANKDKRSKSKVPSQPEEDEVTRLRDQVKRHHDERNKMQEQMKRKLAELRAENHKLREDCVKLETSIDYWRNRVSKIAGAKLTDNNPGIADLSDPNRPTKLGELLNEIYDNIWTDTLELLVNKANKMTEREAIDHLVQILKECYRHCQETIQKTIVRIENALDLSEEVTKKSTKTSDSLQLDIEERKQLKDLLKSTGLKTSKCLKEEDVLKRRKELDKYKNVTKPFAKQCLEVCWLMLVQDPPVIFEWGDEKPGSKIDLDKFKAYTRSGVILEYVVWPAMVLHQGGPTLNKGVAQPTSSKTTTHF